VNVNIVVLFCALLILKFEIMPVLFYAKLYLIKKEKQKRRNRN
jgi:hypothetical protein